MMSNMPDRNYTELFGSTNEHARYAVDLLTRVVKKVEEANDYDARKVLGGNLWREVCHAVGWDIDWEALANR